MNRTMFSYVYDTYVRLTPKAKSILAVLILDYEENMSDGLTRRQIAGRLGQSRLYPHDDKAIRMLEVAGFIYVYREQLRHAFYRQWGDMMPIRSKSIAMYSPYHRHVFNEDYFGYLVPLLKADRKYREPDFGVIGDLMKDVSATWDSFKAIFTRKKR